MELVGKKVLVCGLARSGRAAALLLQKRGAMVTVQDKKTAEELTGLDFFSAVPKEKQEQMERTITVENWDWIRK